MPVLALECELLLCEMPSYFLHSWNCAGKLYNDGQLIIP